MAPRPAESSRGARVAEDPALQEMVRRVLDTNHYMTLGTVDAAGSPRVSPVYYTHFGYDRLYWVSSPEARHSRNLATHPDLEIVIFDSTAPVGKGEAVYLTARVTEVAESDLPGECAAAFSTLTAGARAFSPQELSGDADLRLYRADVRRHEVHIRGGDPVYGAGTDRRREVAV